MQSFKNKENCFKNENSQMCKGLFQGQNVELNHRGQLPSQTFENPKLNPPRFVPTLNAFMVHTQDKLSQCPQMEEL